MSKEDSRGNVGSDRRRPRAKRTYKPPELVKWGSIREITRGPTAGSEDGFASGTQPF